MRSLRGKRVVLTGALPILREDAKLPVRKAGEIAEDRVSHRMDVVVPGERSRHWKAVKKGRNCSIWATNSATAWL